MSAGRILVVDDEKTIRSTLEDYFVSNGYYVVTAVDGEDAIEKFSPGEFDCVISDLMMPRINGVDLLKKIRILDKDVLFLMITAYPSIDNAIAAMNEGAYDFVTKPFHMEDLHMKVEKILNAKKIKESLKTKKNLLWCLIISIPICLIIGIILGRIWK